MLQLHISVKVSSVVALSWLCWCIWKVQNFLLICTDVLFLMVASCMNYLFWCTYCCIEGTFHLCAIEAYSWDQTMKSRRKYKLDMILKMISRHKLDLPFFLALPLVECFASMLQFHVCRVAIKETVHWWGLHYCKNWVLWIERKLYLNDLAILVNSAAQLLIIQLQYIDCIGHA